MYSLIREGEIDARVKELTAAREAENNRMRIVSLGSDTGAGMLRLIPNINTGGDSLLASTESMDTSTTGQSPNGLGGLAPKALVPLQQQLGSPDNAPAAPVAQVVVPRPPIDVDRLALKMEMMERQLGAMRVALTNSMDENRFMRVEIDVLREAVVGNVSKERALNVLDLIGRRAGTREMKLSVCTRCLSKTECFACYACRSIEYCSSKCQMEDMPRHIALCRHITERSF